MMRTSKGIDISVHLSWEQYELFSASARLNKREVAEEVKAAIMEYLNRKIQQLKTGCSDEVGKIVGILMKERKRVESESVADVPEHK